MRVKLTDKQIESIRAKTTTETDRDIYTIHFDSQDIIINGDWSIERNKMPINENIKEAIEAYCTKSNIEWEYNSTYSMWCD